MVRSDGVWYGVVTCGVVALEGMLFSQSKNALLLSYFML